MKNANSWYGRICGNRRGIALMVAIAGTMTIMIGIAALNMTTLAEVEHAGLLALRCRANLALVAGLEHSLAAVRAGGGGSLPARLDGSGAAFGYSVDLSRTRAAEYDPLASSLGARGDVYVARIRGVPLSPEQSEAGMVARGVSLAASAVIDAGTGHRVLLWVRE